MVPLRLLLLLSLLGLSTGQENGSSRFNIPIPPSLKQEGGYKHLESMFGAPQFGGSISQNVYYADSNLCNANVDTHKGYPERKKVDGRMESWPAPFILMVDTGGCSFVTKVRNAQHSGAAAVLLANIDCVCSDQDCRTENHGYCNPDRPSMVDDGSGSDISIPSFLLFKQDADRIKEQLINNVPVVAEMSWNLPSKAGERVKYELWTVPTDVISREFFLNFADYAFQLEEADFTPHIYLQSGLSNACQYNKFGEQWCETGCTNRGHYCALDPDHDVTRGISGGDVVEEGLRRLCIWSIYKDSRSRGWEWWLYVSRFSFECETVDRFRSSQCIEDVYKSVSVDKSMVENCMRSSGGISEDHNALLDAEVKASEGIVVFPTMRVNGIEVRGSLTAENVFSAICAAFDDSDRPSICTCTQCLDVHGCVDNGGLCAMSRMGTSGSSGKSKGVSPFTFVLTFVLVIGAFGGVGFWYYKKSRAQMRDRVRDILAEYMPLEDQPIAGPTTLDFSGSAAVGSE